MDAYRRAVYIKGGRDGHLPELVVAFGDMGHSDGAVRLGFLGGDHLSIPQYHENGPG